MPNAGHERAGRQRDQAAPPGWIRFGIKLVRTSDESYDRALAARLWKVSEELTGLPAS